METTMRAHTWEQIELQHRYNHEYADDSGEKETGESADDNRDGDGADDSGETPSDNVFGADDLLEQMEDDAAAMGAGAWYATCSSGHGPWTGHPQASYDKALEDASEHDDQYHNGDYTAGVSS